MKRDKILHQDEYAIYTSFGDFNKSALKQADLNAIRDLSTPFAYLSDDEKISILKKL